MNRLTLIFCLMIQVSFRLLCQNSTWDTLEVRSPNSQISPPIQIGNRFVTSDYQGVAFTDNFASSWQRASGISGFLPGLWEQGGKIYVNKELSPLDSIWVSLDNGSTFMFWGISAPKVGTLKAIINNDTIIGSSLYDTKIYKKVKNNAAVETLFEVPAFDYVRDLKLIDHRLILLTKHNIWISDDYGNTWNNTNVFLPPGTDNSYLFTNNNIIYYYDNQKYIYRSVDKGSNWEEASFPLTYATPLIRLITDGDNTIAVQIKPTGGYVTWISTDSCATWTETSGISAEDGIPSKVVSSLNGKLLFSNNGCFTLNANGGVDETRNVNLSSLPIKKAYLGTDGSWVVIEDSRIYRSADGGKTYKLVQRIPLTYASIQQNSTILIFNFRSDDNGLNWYQIDTPEPVNVIYFSQFDENNILVLLNKLNLYLYNLNTNSWTYLSCPGDISPFVYKSGAILTQNGTSGVSISNDLGLSFIPSNEGLPNNFQDFEPYVFDDGFIINSGFFGNYLSKDIGLHWDQTLESNGAPLPYLLNIVQVGDNFAGVSLLNRIRFSDNDGYNWYESAIPSGNDEVYFLKAYGDFIYVSLGPPDGRNCFVLRRNISNLAFETVKGVVFSDTNLNQVKDPGEPGIGNTSVYGSNGAYACVTDKHGRYLLPFQPPFDTIRTALNLSFYETNPPFYPASQPADNLNFAVQSEYHDVEIELGSGDIGQPGFQQQFSIQVFNKGFTAESTIIKVLLDPRYVNITANPPCTFSGDTLVWVLNDLPILQYRHLYVTAKLNNSTPLGVELQSYAWAIPVQYQDDFPVSNTALLKQISAGSFDPNDKIALSGPTVSKQEVMNGKEIEYLIRFQNTGSLPAQFVRVRDTLSEQLIPGSFKLLSTSHPVEVQIFKGNILDFYFPGIQLPDSTSNEAASHGFIHFKISLVRTLGLGAIVQNSAGIYFDYNPPIITPISTVTVSSISGVHNPEKIFMPLIIPNPAGESTSSWIQFPTDFPENAYVKLQIYDQNGRLLHLFERNYTDRKLSLPQLPPGTYEINVICLGKSGACTWLIH